MIIKCPQCGTGYNIPDNVIGDKPRKMRCTKCQNMFAVARHSEHPPEGYIEYTGKQHLPSEFAFLRKSIAPPPAAEEIDVELDSQPPAVEPPPAPASPPPQSAATGDAAARSTQPVGSITGRNPVDGRTSGLSPIEMFGSGQSAWEIEAPLELGGYALRHTGDHIHAGHNLLGKIMFSLLVLVISLLIFVSWRNGWVFSPLDLPEHVAFAFSGQPREVMPESVENIDVTVLERTAIAGAAQTMLLSVSGEVYNNNPTARDNVLLRARLIDSTGDIRAETRVPCGRTFDEITLKSVTAGSVKALYLVDGQMYNCHLSPDGSTIFQVVFDKLPVDYDTTYKVDIRAAAAIMK